MVILSKNFHTGFFTDICDDDGNVLLELRIHSLEDCAGRYCDVHDRPHPSDPLKDAPLNWRGDVGKMERICECGIGHTTYAQGRYWATFMEPEDVVAYMSHGCCGHCVFDDGSSDG